MKFSSVKIVKKNQAQSQGDKMTKVDKKFKIFIPIFYLIMKIRIKKLISDVCN